MSVDMFGRYQSQTTRQLTKISSSKYPDTNKDMEANIRRLNQFVDYIAQYLQVMQKGVDQANEDALQRLKGMAGDLVALLGGGELLYGIDLGDLQYFLPALGAIFGFDADTPFPINLFNMVEHFFLGYVVPLDAFAYAIQDIINGWGEALGINEEYMHALNDVMTELINLGTSLGDILNNLFDLLDILGINTDGFGVFADLWHAITTLLGSFHLEDFGTLTDPIFEAVAPWVAQLAQLLNDVNSIIEAFSGGLTDLQGILNFASLFTGFTDLLSGAFDPVSAWGDIITNVINPLGLITSILDPNAPLNALNLFNIGNLLGSIGIGQLSLDQPNLLDNPDFREAISVQGGGIWTYDDTKGRTVPGSAKVTGASVLRQLMSNAIKVSENDDMHLSIFLQWAGLTYTGTQPLKLQVVRLLYSSISQSFATMGTDTIATIDNPSATQSTWIEFDDDYTVPANTSHIAMQLTMEGTVSAGSAWWDDAEVIKTGLLQIPWVSGLSTQLSTFLANFQDTWDAIVHALGGVGPGFDISDVQTYLAEIPSAFQEITDVVTDFFNEPTSIVSEVAGAFSDFLGIFFRGGPKQVVSQDVIAEPSGVGPLGADGRQPWEYLPVELMQVAIGYPWVEVPKVSGSQSIPTSTETLLTGWDSTHQVGPITMSFTSNKFKLPFDGMWNLEFIINWSSAPVSGPLTLVLKQNSNTIRTIPSYGTGVIAYNFDFPAATTDEFGVWVTTPVGSMSVITAGTIVRATYIGQTTVPSLPPPAPDVQFGSIGGGDHGSGTIQWNQTFTADDKAVIIPISHENPGIPHITVGGWGGTIPVLSGPTFIGNYFGANARGSLAGMMLPAGFAGTTKTITVDWGGSGNAASANSISFKNVVSLGIVKTSSGSGSSSDEPNISVPSNVSSMVVCQFAGMDQNFSGFNRTLGDDWDFSAFDTWAHMWGYARGGQAFSATGGKWIAKAIELSNH